MGLKHVLKVIARLTSEVKSHYKENLHTLRHICSSILGHSSINYLKQKCGALVIMVVLFVGVVVLVVGWTNFIIFNLHR